MMEKGSLGKSSSEQKVTVSAVIILLMLVTNLAFSFILLNRHVTVSQELEEQKAKTSKNTDKLSETRNVLNQLILKVKTNIKNYLPAHMAMFINMLESSVLVCTILIFNYSMHSKYRRRVAVIFIFLRPTFPTSVLLTP